MSISRSLVRSMYDLQSMRIQTGNRIVAEIKIRLGQGPGEKEQEIDDEGKDYLLRARDEYKRIADAFVLSRPSNYLKVDYKKYQVISDEAMLLFVQSYVKQFDNEEHMEKVIATCVKQHPLWEVFLKDVKGCGPLMSAVILTEFDIRKANRISKFWKYAGLDVAADGRGRGRHKDHLVDQSYTDADGKEQTKKGITFNPFLKTKMVGVLGSCFLRTKGVYREVYDGYKNRIENHPNHQEKSKGHRHNMAMRYMVKMFLQDLWLAWRELEGLEITRPYNEAVLGHKHAS